MEILEAFDLTGSCRSAAELAGCSHHTVEHYVTLRDEGRLAAPGEPQQRSRLIDPHLPKVEEWVERSNGKIRADVVADKLAAVGFAGSERTVRRAVAAVKASYRAGRRRVYRPWIPEPGMWAQWDWGQGPRVGGRPTNLFCAWLAWCRFRVMIPTWDRTMPTLIGCLDRAMRAFGGCPTYWLTDNERTVTIDHVAGVAVRHPLIVEVGHHYGVTIATCVPADPESKGGSEATVRVAKADLVPTEANLLDDYAVVGRARRRLRGVHRRGQRPGASGHPAATDRDARRGTGPAAPTAGDGVHRGVRGDPQGVVVVDDQLRRGHLLGSAPVDRRRGVGPGRR